MNPFLPISKEDMKKRGWDQLDFVLVSADAYVDHPSFGAAIIARVLESQGFRVGVLAQPDWRREESFLALGRPKLAFLVSAAVRMSTVPAEKRDTGRIGQPLSIPGS